jgi:cyclopropane-fatty-acyl-phospholipid synthase
MARHYGVTVRAFNISREQIDYAREQARQQHLDDQVEFIEGDWRNISGKCDAFVSVGMLEHVGVTNFRRLGETIDSCLAANGIGLIHSIGQNFARQLNPWIERRIFPGACPPSLREMMDIFEPNGFSILDVENLRLHYAETLRHWLERFERCADVVRTRFDEQFVRAWRFYLLASAVSFESGGLQLFQVLFSRNTNNNVPRTRASLYTPQSRRLRRCDGHAAATNRTKISQQRIG